MAEKPALVIAGLAGLVASCVCAVRLLAEPFIDPDLFLNAWIGDYVLQNHSLPTSFGLTTFSVTNVSFVPQEWVLGVLAALSFEHHLIWLLALITALFIGGAIFLIALRALRFGATIPATLICLVYVVVNFFGTMAIKQQDFMWIFLAALLYLLDFESPVYLLSIPLIVLWANLHGGVFIAIPVFWIDAITAWYQRGFSRAYQRCVVAVLAPFTILLTPFGTRLPAMVWHIATNPAVRRVTDEFTPPRWYHGFFLGGSFVLFVVVVFYSRTLTRERLRDMIYVAFFFLVALSAARNTALLGIACAPLAARALSLFVRDAKPQTLRFARFFGTVFVGSTCAVFLYIDVAIPVMRSFRGPSDLERIASTLTNLSAAPGEHRLFCEDYAFCSLALQGGGIRVYMNSDVEAFPLQVIDDYNNARFVSPGWQEILAKYRANMILTHEDSRFDKAISHDSRWKRIASSGHSRIYATSL